MLDDLGSGSSFLDAGFEALIVNRVKNTTKYDSRNFHSLVIDFFIQLIGFAVAFHAGVRSRGTSRYSTVFRRIDRILSFIFKV